jgi:urea carboxylase
VEVAAGDRVAVGQTLVIIEAMKMETSVQSPCDGVVHDVMVTPGTQVHTGAPLAVVQST